MTRPSGDAVTDVSEWLTPERRERIDFVVRRRLASLRVVLEDVHDPHNQSAVLRTAEALGILSVHVVEGPRSRFSPARKISCDADKWLDLRRHGSIDECVAALRGEGIALYGGTSEPGALPLWDLDVLRPCAFVFGNEHEGLSAAARAGLDATFTVPMRGFVESLNVSVAAAIALAHAVRQREQAGRPSDLAEAERERLRIRYEQRSLRSWGASAGPGPPPRPFGG